ncbi:MAG: tRNA guanosine(34) transglycosylase Tgt [Patescibacteria group bacterium]
MAIKFSILKNSTKSRARLGILKTSHGEVETPALVPVATQGAVKALTNELAEQAGCQLLIANTFHLHLRPGEQVIEKMGGLHAFMNWPRPLMTDSGGFQVFSLGFGRDYGMGKILKEKEKSGRKIKAGQKPSFLKITDEGVHFSSPIDGKKLFIGPRESMAIQEALGADIIFAFDECTSPIADREYTVAALRRTNRWARICVQESSVKGQVLYGVVQGGKFADLRKESAKFIATQKFDGIGIGGEFGDDKATMTKMLRVVINELPDEKPRHLLGIGHPGDIERIVKEGIDTFDCTAPTHYARHGTAFTSNGRIDINKSAYLKDKRPIDPECGCFVCHDHSRSYLCHLFRSREMTAGTLLTFHNLFYFNKFVAGIRAKIRKGLL